MPPTQHIRAFFAVRYTLLYSLSVTTPAEHLFLVRVHAIKIGRLNLCRKDRSNWKLLSVCSRCLCRQNPGLVTTAQLMPSEPVVPKGCGYSWGKGNISETILRLQNLAFQIRTKSEGLQIPCLYLSQMLQLQADWATPFIFHPGLYHAMVFTLVVPPADKGRGETSSRLVLGPLCSLSHVDVSYHPSPISCTHLTQSPAATVKSPPGEHPWLSGSYYASFKAALWCRAGFKPQHF